MPKAYSYLRFSTPEQSRGDSSRRQLELSRAYAAEHGLDLVESFELADRGMSAFHGVNIIEGALGQFINAVDSGVVPSGSYLLVESLDRLSRDKVLVAHEHFSALLRKGIVIVTLIDRKTYTLESVSDNFTDLMGSLMIMFRAHEESLTKSKRLKAAWENKRANADNRPLTAVCPAWLELDQQTNTFKIIESRAAIVRRIYQMTIQGIGKTRIMKTLNDEGIESFGKSVGWHTSYIQKILTNSAVIGEFQPHKTETTNGKKKRIPDGQIVSGYYPSIVSKDDFYRANEIRKQRRIPSGPRGKRLSNLFTGLAHCGFCGASMHYVSKGNNQNYLVCSNAKRGMGSCNYVSWRYPNIEEFIILALNEVDYRELFPRVYEKSLADITAIENELFARQQDLDIVSELTDGLVKALIARPDSKRLLSKFDEYEAEEISITADKERLAKLLTKTRELQSTSEKSYADANNAFRQWINKQQSTSQNTAYQSRAKLASILKRIISGIVFTIQDDTNQHGTIVISFNGDSEYQRVIDVMSNQSKAYTYKLADGRRSDRHLLKILTTNKIKRVDKKHHTTEKFPRFVN